MGVETGVTTPTHPPYTLAEELTYVHSEALGNQVALTVTVFGPMIFQRIGFSSILPPGCVCGGVIYNLRCSKLRTKNDGSDSNMLAK